MDWVVAVPPNRLGSEDTEASRYPRPYRGAWIGGPPAGTPQTVSPRTAGAVPAGRGAG